MSRAEDHEDEPRVVVLRVADTAIDLIWGLPKFVIEDPSFSLLLKLWVACLDLSTDFDHQECKVLFRTFLTKSGVLSLDEIQSILSFVIRYSESMIEIPHEGWS